MRPWEITRDPSSPRPVSQNTTYSHGQAMGMDPKFDNTPRVDIEPLSIAQRIMDVRVQLAEEMVEDLEDVRGPYPKALTSKVYVDPLPPLDKMTTPLPLQRLSAQGDEQGHLRELNPKP